MQGPPVLTPKQYLYFYPADEWEEFTCEWVRALDHPYVLVTRMGGAGDRGADIAACLTEQGTNGVWHCYQCKHYEEALAPGDAYPEMFNRRPGALCTPRSLCLRGTEDRPYADSASG
jgi:hypothetical protein